MRRLPFVLYSMPQLAVALTLPQLLMGHGFRDILLCLLLGFAFSIPISVVMLRRSGLPFTTSAERYHRRLQTSRQTPYLELQAGREFWAVASQVGRGRATALGV
jgi:hypothetical protein